MTITTTLRVLCISPRFAPVNAADSHRIRLLLPYMQAHGCALEVLAVDPRDVPGPCDDWLASTLPADVPVHRVRAWPLRGWGLNGLAQRSVWPLYRKGSDLLATRQFDLVFFSTTESLLQVLGPFWKRKFGVPFCIDYQDAWVTDYYSENPHVTPPGGREKFAVANRLHRAAERFVVSRCSGFLSVSPDYLADIDRRYGGSVAKQPRVVAGFPAEPREIASISAAPMKDDGTGRVWRYVGRGGDDMAMAAAAFFRAWRISIDRGLIAAGTLRFEAIGTSYATDTRAQPTLAPLAAISGVGDWVSEDPKRVGYQAMLSELATSDALVVFGSDDPAYTASKIYPYLLAGKPLLALFHARSSVVALMQDVGGGVCITFDGQDSVEALAERIVAQWFARGDDRHATPLQRERFDRFTAESQAGLVSRWLRETCESARREIDAAIL